MAATPGPLGHFYSSKIRRGFQREKVLLLLAWCAGMVSIPVAGTTPRPGGLTDESRPVMPSVLPRKSFARGWASAGAPNGCTAATCRDPPRPTFGRQSDMFQQRILPADGGIYPRRHRQVVVPRGSRQVGGIGCCPAPGSSADTSAANRPFYGALVGPLRSPQRLEPMPDQRRAWGTTMIPSIAFGVCTKPYLLDHVAPSSLRSRGPL